jgi:hypothetical protein
MASHSEDNDESDMHKSSLFSKEYEKVDEKDLMIERLKRQVEEQAKRINLLELQYTDIVQRMSVKIKKQVLQEEEEGY